MTNFGIQFDTNNQFVTKGFVKVTFISTFISFSCPKKCSLPSVVRLFNPALRGGE